MKTPGIRFKQNFMDSGDWLLFVGGHIMITLVSLGSRHAYLSFGLATERLDDLGQFGSVQ